MNPFTYYNPVRVYFGEHALEQVGEAAKPYGTRALLVSYRHTIHVAEAIESIHRQLKDAGIACTDCFSVTANPLLSQAREGVKLCRDNRVDLVIGLGGGSVMDCAKAIAAGACYDGEDIGRMFVFSHSHPTHTAPVKALPTVMIPTLPATGSEMNPCAVLTDDDTHKKSYMWAECIYPQAAVIDPCLTVSLPRYQTVCGAVDTIAHVMEAYVNGNDSNLILQDHMEEGVIRSVMETLPTVLAHPDDLQARGVMLWAANIALCGWINSGTMIFTPMHQLAHVLSAQYGATHGATLACMMPAWMRFRARHGGAGAVRCRQFAERIFECTDIDEAADRFENWMKDLGVETRISAFGVRAEDIDRLAQQVREVSFNEDDVLGSFPTITLDDVREVYTLAL